MLIREDKTTVMHGRCELPCTCAGACATDTTNLYPHRRISIPFKEITSVEVIRWQNEMMKQKLPNGKSYFQTYQKTLRNQLSPIFTLFYKLSENPARVAGAVGKKEGGEMSIWSAEE